jgi:hypothetical protein
MLYAGIDPGKKGAIAILDAAGDFAFLGTIPLVAAGPKGRDEYDIPAIRDLFEPLHKAAGGLFVTVERLHAMPVMFARKKKPGQEVADTSAGGSIVNFNRGVSRGFEWLLIALRIPHLAVPARTWQGVMHEGTPGTDTKQRSILAAHSLFPSVSMHRTARSKKLDDGCAEALLLAEYGRRTRRGLLRTSGIAKGAADVQA